MRLSVSSSRKQELLEITENVEQAVSKSRKKEGLCLVYTPHSTAAIIINENWDRSLQKDIINALGNLIPEGKWEHDKVDDNGAAHIKSAIIGPSQVIPVENGRLVLGKWQGISIAEFDGPRERTVIVKII